MKTIGKPCEGELHARFEVAGDGNVDNAPSLDPTRIRPVESKGVKGDLESEGSFWLIRQVFIDRKSTDCYNTRHVCKIIELLTETEMII